MYVDENHMSKSVVNRWNKQPQNWSRAHSFVHFNDRPDLPTVRMDQVWSPSTFILVNEIIRALETKEHRGAHEYAPKSDILCFL